MNSWKGMFSGGKSQSRSLNTNIVADLDAILVEPVCFVLHGSEHIIRPLTTEQFFRLTSEYTKLLEIQRSDKIDTSDLIDKYYGFVSTVCDSVSRKDIENMTQQQVGALLNLIIGILTGETFKKKVITLPIQQVGQVL
jgi:hypothetical protein